jgi:DNA-directed RNA polymerase subunit RPC12/RpoP
LQILPEFTQIKTTQTKMSARPLVVKEWTVGTKPLDDKGTLIRITGRHAGFIAWAFTKLGVDPAFYFTVSPTKLEFSAAGIFRGRETRIIPLQNVCSTFYGYSLPFFQCILAAVLVFFLVFGFIFGICSFLPPAIGITIGLILGIIVGLLVAKLVVRLVLKYNRVLSISIAEFSGIVSGFSIKKSVIEGIDIDDKKAKIVCELIESLMDSKRLSIQNFPTAAKPSQTSETPADSTQPQPSSSKLGGKSTYAAQEKEFKPKPANYLSEHEAYNQKLKEAGLNPDLDLVEPQKKFPKFLKIEDGAIHFMCAYCNQKMQIDASAGGQEIKCPECGDKQIVPTS